MQFTLVAAGPDLLISVDLLFFKGKFNFSYLFGHMLWGYYF